MDKQISTILREVKDATGWTEARIAQELVTSQPTVNRILNGQDECTVRVLRAIEALHARVSAAPHNPPAAGPEVEPDRPRRNPPSPEKMLTLRTE